MACDGAPNSNKELTHHSYVCPHVGMRFKVKTGERISMVTNLSDCVGCTCLKGQENTTLLYKKPVSCVKVFYRRWEDLCIGKKCITYSARFVSKHRNMHKMWKGIRKKFRS